MILRDLAFMGNSEADNPAKVPKVLAAQVTHIYLRYRVFHVHTPVIQESVFSLSRSSLQLPAVAPLHRFILIGLPSRLFT